MELNKECDEDTIFMKITKNSWPNKHDFKYDTDKFK